MKKNRLAPTHRFLVRLIRSFMMSFVIIIIALFIGILGYHFLEGMSWIDAFVNAAMILSGMGPLDALTTFNGKIFAGLYALFSGLAIIVIIGLIIAPVIHRFIHKFNLEDEDGI